jgi:hypothetical protein
MELRDSLKPNPQSDLIDMHKLFSQVALQKAQMYPEWHIEHYCHYRSPGVLYSVLRTVVDLSLCNAW